MVVGHKGPSGSSKNVDHIICSSVAIFYLAPDLLPASLETDELDSLSQ